MATYYVYSGAGGANTGGSWADAYTTFGSAVTAATTNGDIILVHYTHQDTMGADTTYTFGANVQVISVDKDSSNALTAMGTGGWLGNGTVSYTLSIGGARNLFFSGITLRVAGAATEIIGLGLADGIDVRYEDCYFWLNSSSGSSMRVGNADAQALVSCKNCTFRFGHASQTLQVVSRMTLIGGSVSSAGTIPSSLIACSLADPAGSSVDWLGGDLSALGGSNVVGNCTSTALTVRLSQCKLGTFPPPLATQSNLNGSSAEIYAFDCATGDTHGLFAYVNPLGSVSSDTGIYFTAGAAAQSWKIVTTSAANFYTPFETPWFGYWNTVTTAITPYVEILRDGSATAYQDDEVWLDVMAKTNTGSTQSALTTDRMTLLGTPANQDAGAGLGSWTGESGTAWSGKLQVASLTPAEVGRLSARVVVGEPSVTVYADPQIRT